KAIEYEIERQVRALENGETITQETRLYDAAHHRTRPMRSKEDADDYRYFPDPDLPPLMVSATDIDSVRDTMPELPDTRRRRYVEALGLPDIAAAQLGSDRAMSDCFEAMHAANPTDAKACANWILGELAAALTEANLPIESS